MSFVKNFDSFELCLDALNDAKLGDAIPGFDLVSHGREVGENDLDLAAVAGIDDAGKGGDAFQGETGTVFDEGSEAVREAERDAGGDGNGVSGSDSAVFDSVKVAGEIAVGAGMGVAGNLCAGMKFKNRDFCSRMHTRSLSCPNPDSVQGQVRFTAEAELVPGVDEVEARR